MKQQLFKIRTWHAWGGLFIVLPLLVVAVTALLMAHRVALGTDELKVAAHWLPGYRAAAAGAGRNEPRCSLVAANGETYIGTLGGLYRLNGDRLLPVAELAETQIRGLAEAPWGRVAAARNGVWLQAGSAPWRRVASGDAGSAAVRPDGSVAVAVRGAGLLVSSDGRLWSADPKVAAALAALPVADEPISLSRLAFDLHSGRALLGRDGEWLWIDLSALAIVLLALTGSYTWLRNRARRARQRLH